MEYSRTDAREEIEEEVGAKSSRCGVAAWRVARVASSNQVVEWCTTVYTVQRPRAIVLHRRIHL